MYINAEKQFAIVKQHQDGMRLAKEARDKGDQRLAWQHAKDYNLSAYDVLSLRLSRSHKPRDFTPRVPKAMGCV